MGVYINMEMPKTGRYFVAVDNTDGKDKTVISVMSEFERGDKTRPLLAVHEVIPVPPHGDLVDRDVLKKQGYFFPCAIGTEYAIPLRALREAPAVIPAEPCNNLSKPCKDGEP